MTSKYEPHDADIEGDIFISDVLIWGHKIGTWLDAGTWIVKDGKLVKIQKSQVKNDTF